jgi:hypothetical protein
LRIVPRFAAICTVAPPIYASLRPPSIFRSKFNTALGIDAQGFCVLR